MSSQRGFVRRRGSTWTAYWQLDTSEGRKQRTKGGFATRRDAQAFLTETLAALRGGVFAEPTRVTFGDYLTERWLPARSMSLRPSTLNSYVSAINRHVVPALGHIKIRQLTPDRLDRFYADLVAGGLATKTVRNIHVIIHKALHDAVRKNLVPRNVAEAADPPKLNRADRDEMHTWTAAQLREFFDGIAKHRLAPAYLLAATTGMRRGEILGLRWRDVDLEQRRLQVNQTVLSVSYEIIYGGPKTARGKRRITLDPETIRVLTAHEAAQRQEMQLIGDNYADQGLVFAREDGRPVHPDYFSQTFDRSVKRLKLPRIRLHDLRHTHATLGLAAGIHVKVMSDRLGHATTSFTQDVYMHAIPELEQDAADQIGDLVFGSPDGVGRRAPNGAEVARAGDADELEGEESTGG